MFIKRVEIQKDLALTAFKGHYEAFIDISGEVSKVLMCEILPENDFEHRLSGILSLF